MTDVHALSGAYAVDALDDLERARFERHLSECADCQQEVASLRETSALLADTVAVTPPASLRDSVLAGIATVRPIPPEVSEPAATSPPRRRWRGLLVAAAAVVAIGGGVGVVQPWEDDSVAPRDLTPTEEVLVADDAQRIVQEFTDGSVATVVVSKELGRSVILTQDMAPAPEGKDYELWYQQPGDGMVSAGLMSDNPDAAAVLLDGDASRAKAVGITVEPDGGSPTGEPTTEPIALFAIPA